MKKGLFRQPILQGYRRLIRHPKYRWAMLLGTLIYLVSPLDLVPDMIPGVGWVDDGLIVTLAVTEVTQLLLDRKRNLRQVAQTTRSSTNTEAPSTTVVDVNVVPVAR